MSKNDIRTELPGVAFFAGILGGILIFFWWLLIYSHGLVIHHG